MLHFFRRRSRRLQKLVVLLFLSNCAAANAAKFSEDVIHSTCAGSENSVERILNRLSVEMLKTKASLSIDIIKQVFFLEMRDYRNELRLQLANVPEPGRSEITSLALSSTSEEFKFALCEKLKNPRMQNDAIKLDAYLKCRETIKTEVEQKPQPCF